MRLSILLAALVLLAPTHLRAETCRGFSWHISVVGGTGSGFVELVLAPVSTITVFSIPPTRSSTCLVRAASPTCPDTGIFRGTRSQSVFLECSVVGRTDNPFVTLLGDMQIGPKDDVALMMGLSRRTIWIGEAHYSLSIEFNDNPDLFALYTKQRR